MNNITYVIIMVVLVILSAYFSATETAFSSLNKTKIKALCEKENKRAQLTYKISEEYDKLISTILIGNNIVNIGLASIGTILFVKIYGDIGATISTAVITVVVLIFGEISPKSIAKDCPEKFAMFSAPVMKVLMWLLTPINFVFSCWKKTLSNVFKTKPDSGVSSEELLLYIDGVEQEGSLDSDDSELIKNAIEFTEQLAEDIITHRVDIEAVDINTDNTEIAKVFAASQYSRLFVYDGSVDNIIGVIHIKDFFTGNGITSQNIRDIMTTPLFIQKNEKIYDLLKLLQKHKAHSAVVIDDFGGTLGIVTMEDILEELVGDIWDEHDEVVEAFEKIDDNTYIVDASINFDSFARFFDIKDDSTCSVLSGWIMEQICKIPDVNDEFVFKSFKIKILEVDTHRIIKVKVFIEEIQSDEE